jgi:hypothetical protein
MQSVLSFASSGDEEAFGQSRGLECWIRISSFSHIGKNVIWRSRCQFGAQQDAAPPIHKYLIGDTDQCSCNTGPMTMSHVLQDCPLREALRKDIWGNGVNLHDQLYGDRADMQWTAEYIRRAGLTVKSSGRTSGQMGSTYRTNCTETERTCRGQRNTSDELDWLSRKKWTRRRRRRLSVRIPG